MKLLISLLLLVTAVLTLAAERRTVVVVRELPPPAAAPVPTAADGERWSGFDAGPGPLPRGCAYETLAEVAVSDSAAAEAVAPFPAEVMAWLQQECRRRGADVVTCILGFPDDAAGFRGQGKLLRFAPPEERPARGKPSPVPPRRP